MGLSPGACNFPSTSFSQLVALFYLLTMLGLAVLSILSIIYLLFTRKRRYSPPGPQPLPLIGNLHQVPSSRPWLGFEKWHKAYGPIISFKLGTQTFISLGSHKIAHDLLDKRSAIYSSRPRSIIAGECITKGLGIVFIPYNRQWRTQHRIQAEFLNPAISKRYRALQDVETRQVVYDLLSSNNFSDNFHRMTSSLIFSLAYGKRMPWGDEHEVREIDELMTNLSEKQAPGKWMVDIFPVLNYLPRFLASWKSLGDEYHQREATLFGDNMKKAESAQSWNWSKDMKRIKEAKRLSETELAYIIGVLYEAGSDTTAGTLGYFVLACVLHPDAMRKVQHEIDDVVGTERLPTFDDIPNLPYANAFLKEVMRWRPLAPLGIPHSVTQDDEYMGYDIPKGATILPNHWALALDEEVFEDPTSFRPERWIENPKLPLNGFGFGRRVCTGRHIAMNSMQLITTRVLWAYDIGYAHENGKKIDVDSYGMADAAISKPVPFKADFQVRSPGHREVVEETWKGTEKDLNLIMTGIGPGRRAL